MPRRSAGLLALTAALVLFGASCTGDDPRAEAGDDPSDPIVVPSDLASPSSSPPIFEPEDAVLNVAISDPSTLDPMRIQDPGSVLVARQVFEGLTRWDPVDEKVVPGVAEGWRVADGGRTFLFRLRPGMTFHDGSPVTSGDFKFAFDRIALKENASDLAYALERVQGFAETNGGRARSLSGVTTPDDLTLVIRLSEPFHDFPALLTHPGLVPLPRSAVADIDTFLSAPIGNGPFQVARAWRPGQPVIVKSFPGFIETPEIDGIRFIPFADASASYLPLVKGDIDVAEVPAGQVRDAAERFGEDGFKPFLAGYYFGFNLDSKELDSIKVRKAINRAIDRSAIASRVYKGTLAAPRGIVPTGMPGFIENLCITLCKHSPSAARHLVRSIPAKARSISIQYTNEAPHGQVADFVADDLRSVGFKVKTKAFKFPKYLKALRDRKQSMYRLGWIAEYPSPDLFLAPLFESTSPDNHSGFSSEKVDRLLAEARAEGSDNRRLQLYIQAEKEILKQVPIAPVGSFVTHWAADSSVRGIRFDPTGGFDAIEIVLDPQESDEA